MNTEHINGIGHLGLPVKDLETTIRFYEGLGFRLAHRTATPDGVNVAFLQLKSCMIEAYQNGEATGLAGAIDHICLDVGDVDAVYEAVKAAGHRMLHDSVQILPFWDKGIRFFTIEGPDAEKIEFCQIL